jgi:Zn-dependent peptidase ImmA (M78 family)
MKIFEVMYESHENDFIKPFLPFVKEYLQVNQLPTIRVVDRIPGADGTTFGCYRQEEETIYIVSKGRHPKDVLRTLAHEIVHYKQDLQDVLDNDSGITGSEEENEANATAGVIMRNYSEQNPE